MPQKTCLMMNKRNVQVAANRIDVTKNYGIVSSINFKCMHLSEIVYSVLTIYVMEKNCVHVRSPRLQMRTVSRSSHRGICESSRWKMTVPVYIAPSTMLE